MNIYYSFPLQQLALHHKKYQSAIDLLKEQDYSLTREWLQDELDRIVLGEPHIPRADMYAYIMDTIRKAAACIFDVTIKSMSIGHQINYALERRKPTLILSDITKSDPIESLMIAGSKSGYLHFKNYTSTQEMLAHIQDFLKDKEIHQPPQRYNLFLEKALADYVDWKAFHQTDTKTDIIAEAIRDSFRLDETYARYQHAQNEV